MSDTTANSPSAPADYNHGARHRPRRHWVVAPTAPIELFTALRDIHPLLAQVLYARGQTTPDQIRSFLDAPIDEGDPFELADMAQAVDRIARAIHTGEQIAVYGDYDCDGVTASALLCTTLRRLGARVCEYFPDRFDEGYGLHAPALDALKAEGVGLVVTVDCGGRALREANHARTIGLDLVITDHHEPEAGLLPDACAVVNPKRPDCGYPFKALAGVGVAYRLAQALTRVLNGPPIDDLLDLVALGTIADVVPLTDENRALTREGLARMNAQPRVGLKALMDVAGVTTGAITATTVGFALAPRLNAAGRLDTARNAYDLLMAESVEWANELAKALNKRNIQRQTITAQTADRAETEALQPEGSETPPLLFAVLEDCAPEREQRISGVIGLAAARLVERYHRPAVVVALNNGEGRGSCRSIEGFHITAALDACGDLLLKYGGHAAAAGFTARAEHLRSLRERLIALAARAQPETGWVRVIRADAEVRLEKLSFETFEALQRLEPHGMSNPRPTFVVRGALVRDVQRVGRAEHGGALPHLRLRLRDARGAIWDAVGWRIGEDAAQIGNDTRIDLAFQLDVNEWQSQKRLQLVIVDWRTSD
ncbi:MAG: single-stranded-DNA-specific exonuclease RecJ [Anaerolineae bacterium]|nr:single-stranded-DNA-specific exonuclease RecJ [Thermoflexales bacterium]MDW8406235.1 single-stranded-DNA-specific exonuclease RecJ [Anaerolineae bacterium]